LPLRHSIASVTILCDLATVDCRADSRPGGSVFAVRSLHDFADEIAVGKWSAKMEDILNGLGLDRRNVAPMIGCPVAEKENHFRGGRRAVRKSVEKAVLDRLETKRILEVLRLAHRLVKIRIALAQSPDGHAVDGGMPCRHFHRERPVASIGFEELCFDCLALSVCHRTGPLFRALLLLAWHSDSCGRGAKCPQGFKRLPATASGLP